MAGKKQHDDLLARAMPHDAYAEQAVLGAMLIDADCVGDVMARLRPEDFYIQADRDIFETIQKMHLSAEPIDGVTVAGAMDLNGTATETSRQYLVQLMDTTPTTANVMEYAKILTDKTLLRQIAIVAGDITGAIQAGGCTAEEVLGAAEQQIYAVREDRYGKHRRVMNASEAARDFCNRQAAEKPDYLAWGMADLDKKLLAQLGDFIVVGGYPSAGKTLLSIQFALVMAKKYRVGYFSLETSPQKLVDRLMSHLAQVPLAKIKTRDLGEADWAALAEAASTLAGLPLDFIDAGGMSIQDVQSMALSRHYQVVFVDYLQLLSAKGRDRYEQVTGISLGLHTLARSNNIAVIALAQLSRPEKTKNNQLQVPTLTSFRESGQIEQDADIAFLLWPSDPNNNRSNRELKVAKNKEGERLVLNLTFDGVCQTMKVAEETPGEKFRRVNREIKEAGKLAGQQTFREIEPGPGETLPF